jgi:2-oxoglutarate ferredoxin oxidoreductase subunit alpha
MRTVLVAELNCAPDKLIPVLHFDGTPITAQTIEEQILAVLRPEREESQDEADSQPLRSA